MTTRLPQRDVIAASWRRVMSSGLQQDDRPAPLLTDIASADPLLDAARPILARAAETLDGTDTALLLVDHESRMVAKVSGDATLERHLEDSGAIAGAAFHEEAMGTTALGTTAEVRGDVIVNSAEHYLEQFKSLSCFGRPIIHPATRRVAGIVCMTEVADRLNPLSVPLVRGLVDDIAQRLLNRSHAEHQAVISTFDQVAHRRDIAVAAVGDDLQLTNTLASQLLAPADFGTLAHLACGRRAPSTITLVSGIVADVTVQHVTGVRRAAVFRLRPHSESLPPARTPIASPPLMAATIAVCGESGTGRTTRALACVPEDRARIIDVPASLLDGSPPDIVAILRASRLSGRGVIIDDADLLDDRALQLLRAALRSRDATDPPIVIVTDSAERLPPAAAGVVACCQRRLAIAPLRQRPTELAALGREVLQRADPPLELGNDAADALMSQDWPGNLTELTIVLGRAASVARARGSRTVRAADLPEDYRTSTRASRLLGLEQAERQAILEALELAEGNKSSAAKSLGISRTTLYARIRALGVLG
ncbi:helix-turn-helix domain-containing protein [Gordonia zhaorongruii]|uniref:helix-turn-helix domain-containing protein n=1 Tax=Gordonia zhaorongruii TaxID=2597659 RepID=UPI00164350BC|nr:helix-turn-helix domain-containing protein [Gordonia zhaorongruii]